MAKQDSITKKITTGKGVVTGFVSLFEPSTKFDKKGTYQCNVLLSKEDGEKLAAGIKAVRTEQFKTYGKGTKVADLTQCVPYEIVDEETGEAIPDAEGRYILKTKASAFIEDGKPTNRVQVYDSKCKHISKVSVGEGTIVKLGLILSGYSVAGKTGVSIKLKGVQIIDLVEYVAGGASAESLGFEEEDGFDFDENEFDGDEKSAENTESESTEEIEEEDF